MILRTHWVRKDEVDLDGEDPRVAVDPWELPQDTRNEDEPDQPAHRNGHMDLDHGSSDTANH